MKTFLGCLFILLGIQVSAQQERTIAIKTRPSWVKEYSYSKQVKDTANLSGGYYNLLSDDQYNTRLKESYHHYVQKVTSGKGLENISTLSQVFDPIYQSLTFHSIDIIRNGEKINQFERGTFQVLKREENLERLVYDGNLTAVFNLHDVQVDDVLDYSYSYKGYNPVFNDKYSQISYLNFSVPVNLVVCRLITEADRAFQIKRFNSAPEPSVMKIGGNIEYEWVLEDVPALLSEEATPGWYDPYDHIQVSDFGSWSDLSSWAANLFVMEKNPTGLLKRVPGIQQANKDESIQRIIQFVQDEVRYLSFSEGIHGYKPHLPGRVLDQRFGDCKDKSVLLSSLLRELGINSNPVLVNTGYGKALPDYLPAPNLFNHCVVQFTLRDSVFWIDPTYTYQRGAITKLFFPRYHHGLIVDSNNKSLVALPASPEGTLFTREDFYLDKVGGSASLTVKSTYTRQEADNIREYFRSNSLTEVEKQYLNFYATDYAEIAKGKTIKWNDDEVHNIITSEENYQISKFWLYDSLQKKYSVSTYPRNLASYLVKPATKIRQAPYAMTFPSNVSHKIIVHMPEEWNVKVASKSIESAGFSYHSDISYVGQTIMLSYHYQSKKPYLEALEIKDHVAKLDEALNDLTFIISHATEDTAKELFNLPFLLILLLILFASFFGFRYLYNLDPDPKPAFEKHMSIGGWLLLPALGLCLTPLKSIYDLLSLEYFHYSNWQMLSDPTFGGYNPAMGSFVLIEMLVNYLLLVYSAFLIFMFFKRRTSVPLLVTAFYTISCINLAADAFIASQFGTTVDKETVLGIVRSIIAAVIWIPYFLTSERSKGTFTVRQEILPSQQKGQQEVYVVKHN